MGTATASSSYVNYRSRDIAAVAEMRNDGRRPRQILRSTSHLHSTGMESSIEYSSSNVWFVKFAVLRRRWLTQIVLQDSSCDVFCRVNNRHRLTSVILLCQVRVTVRQGRKPPRFNSELFFNDLSIPVRSQVKVTRAPPLFLVLRKF